MSKCKKLRVRIERKKEAEELDLGNIIKDSGKWLHALIGSPYYMKLIVQLLMQFHSQ